MPDFGRRTSNGGDPSIEDVNRVDEFFDALGSRRAAYSTDRAEAELAYLFAEWRDDVRDAPATVPVTVRDATDALREGLSRGKRSGRASLALVGSAAAAVLCLGGFGAAVLGSGPGDALYGVRTNLLGPPEVRDDRVSLASQQLQQVQQLIDQGQWQQAQDKLVALSSTVQDVDAAPQQKQDLIQQWNTLSYKVVAQDPGATLPPAGEPLPALPNSPLTLLPVPAIAPTTTSSTSTTTTSSSSETSPATSNTTPSTTTSTTTSPTTSTTTSPTTTPGTPTTTATTTPPTTTAASPTTSTTTTQPTTSTTTSPVGSSSSTSVASAEPSSQVTSVSSAPATSSTVASSTQATVSQSSPTVASQTQPTTASAPR